MSEFLCKNCGTPMKAVWTDREGYVPVHYENVICQMPEFEPEDAEVLDNDYAS